MKVFAISDLHLCFSGSKPMDIFGEAWENYLFEIEKEVKDKVGADDLLLLGGDLSWGLKLEDAVPDIRYISHFPGKKILIRGNHDYWWQSISKVRDALPENVFAIQNDVLKFDNVLLCGTRGWTCPDGESFSAEDKKIYLREAGRLKLSMEKMEKIRTADDKVVCLMHYPPFNVRRHPSLFTDIIEEHKTDAVVYGHLHGKDCRADLKIKIRNTEYFLTSCDLTKNSLVRIL